MYSTAYNLWTFTWFVHFELPFRVKRTEKIHTEFSMIISYIFSENFFYWKEIQIPIIARRTIYNFSKNKMRIYSLAVSLGHCPQDLVHCECAMFKMLFYFLKKDFCLFLIIFMQFFTFFSLWSKAILFCLYIFGFICLISHFCLNIFNNNDDLPAIYKEVNQSQGTTEQLSFILIDQVPSSYRHLPYYIIS